MKRSLLFILALIILIDFISCKADLNNPGDPYSSSYKKDKNTLLLGLAISDGTLTPAFDPNVEEYTAGVNNGITGITVTTIAASKYSAIKIDGMDVTSGEASPSIDLAVGNNPITVVVTAEDPAYSTEYSIEMFRAIILPKTGQTTTYSPGGDDGEHKKGAEWPSPRFTANVDNNNDGDCADIGETCDGTVTDNLTGLMWQKDASTGGTNNWADALTYANDLPQATYTDWRLPNVHELRSLINYGATDSVTWLQLKFSNVQLNNYYWSSTTCITMGAYIMHLEDGSLRWDGRIVGMGKGNTYYTWAVRTDNNGIINLPRTGQTTTNGPGDDGESQNGIEWPDPRFINNGNGTVTDRLTSLMWKAEPASAISWTDAVTYANDSVQSGYTYWRLPNINELVSLLNLGVSSTSTWLNGNGFINVPASSTYWTSTTYAWDPDFKWTVSMDSSTMTSPVTHSISQRVLIVRDNN